MGDCVNCNNISCLYPFVFNYSLFTIDYSLLYAIHFMVAKRHVEDGIIVNWKIRMIKR
jgi:hypothetical protein